jgi:hypothetical protein
MADEQNAPRPRGGLGRSNNWMPPGLASVVKLSDIGICDKDIVEYAVMT